MKKKNPAPMQQGDFESLVASIVRIHQQAQDVATKAVNVGLTLRNWFIGHRIVEFEQHGDNRAVYGESLIDTLAQSLAAHGLPRVTPRELRRFRQLYQVYPRIWESVTPKSLAQAAAGVRKAAGTNRRDAGEVEGPAYGGAQFMKKRISHGGTEARRESGKW